jgi:hypothetical protein
MIAGVIIGTLGVAAALGLRRSGGRVDRTYSYSLAVVSAGVVAFSVSLMLFYSFR